MTEPELKGPIKSVRFVHRAIVKESRDFQAAASAIDGEHDLAALGKRFADFEKVLKMHEDSEDLGIFPALQGRFPYIVDTYEYDHRHHRDLSEALSATLRDIGSARGDQRQSLVKRLGEEATAYEAFMVLHVDKEDELLFPLYDQSFSVQEQVEHGKASQGRIPQETMALAGGWVFQRSVPDDREAFLRELMAMLPPEAFRGMTSGLSMAIAPADWQEMVRRIPELSPQEARA
jgi:hemerythrin-like domain-containing protein